MTGRILEGNTDKGSTVKVTLTNKPLARRCGDCQLCCKLLPMHKNAYPPRQIAEVSMQMIAAGVAKPNEFVGMVADFDKPAGERCPHQKFGKGCSIYGRRPFGCRFWNCQWLLGTDTADLHRPDHAGFVVDVMPDFVTVDPGDGSGPTNVEVLQIWVDGSRPNAWREDKSLAAFLERRGAEGKAALIRLNSRDAFVRFPAAMCSDNEVHEVAGTATGPTRIGQDRFDGLAKARKIKLEVPT